jgi:hypothetical protein
MNIVDSFRTAESLFSDSRFTNEQLRGLSGKSYDSLTPFCLNCRNDYSVLKHRRGVRHEEGIAVKNEPRGQHLLMSGFFLGPVKATTSVPNEKI